MVYVLMVDQLERQWHTESLCAAMIRAQGGEAEMDDWPDRQDRFDAYLASEPAELSEDAEARRLLGLK